MSERLVLLNANYSQHNPKHGDIPSREEDILDFIQDEKAENKSGKTTVVLIDTIWNNRFGEDEPGTGENLALADHLGMRAAFHTLINDQELNQHAWKRGVGITVATDHGVAMEEGESSAQIVRLGKGEKARNALTIDLELGPRALTLAAVYLPETDSHAQLDQIRDLELELNGPFPAPKPSGHQIIAGDFNALDRHSHYKGLLPRLGSTLVRQLAKRAERSEDKSYREKTLLALDRRILVTRMRQWGYSEANTGPTYPSKFPLLNPDHVFSYGVRQTGVKTAGSGLSDHLAIVYDFELR